MNEFVIGILSSIVASIIWAFFSRNSKKVESISNIRWFWRFLLFFGRPLFLFGLFILLTNLIIDPENVKNIGMGGLMTFLGLIAWLLGFMFS